MSRVRRLLAAGLLELLLITAIASAAGAAEAPASPQENLRSARRYFQAGFYPEAEKLCRAVLAAAPEGAEADEATFYLGRSLYAIAADDDAKMQEALPYFETLSKGAAGTPFADEALYWAGRTELDISRAVADPKEARERARRAIALFDTLLHTVERGELDYNAQLDRGHALARLAGLAASAPPLSPADAAKEYEPALEAFHRLALHYEDRDTPRFVQILLLYRSGDYASVPEAAARFLKDFAESPFCAEAQMQRATCLYLLGELEAGAAYEKAYAAAEALARTGWTPPAGLGATPPGEMLTSCLYGKGLSYMRLSATKDREERLRDLARAAAAFSAALEAMDAGDTRRSTARLERAEALVQIGEPAQALALLRGEPFPPAFELRSLVLTGKAAAGAKRVEEAREAFRHAAELATGQEQPRETVEILESAARLQVQEGRHDLACLYYTVAIRLAERLRDAGALARARFGRAVALLELSTPRPAARAATEEGLARAAWRLLGQTGADASLYADAREDTIQETRALALASAAAPDSFADALATLDSLAAGQGEHIRLDELYFHKGKGFAGYARREAGRLHERAPRELTGEAARRVRTLFEESDAAFNRSLSANPQGSFATRTLYELGLTRFDAGVEYDRLFSAFEAADRTDAAQIYREQARLGFRGALEPLGSAILFGEGDALAPHARFLLAQAHERLGEDTEAEAAFRQLLNEPELESALRAAAALRLGRLLRRAGRLAEATEILEPYRELDREILLLTGEIYLERDLPSTARQIFLEAAQLSPPATPPERALQAGILFHGHATGLRLAASEKTDNPRSILSTSLNGLAAVAASYPETAGAADARAALVQDALAHQNYASALSLAETGLRELASPAGRQRMEILAGTVHAARGDREGAKARFDRAAAADWGEGAEANALRADAILRRARIEREGGETEQALRSFARVFAEFAGVVPTADAARFEAADLLVTLGRSAEAIPVLRSARDLARARAIMRAIDASAAEAEKDRTGAAP